MNIFNNVLHQSAQWDFINQPFLNSSEAWTAGKRVGWRRIVALPLCRQADFGPRLCCLPRASSWRDSNCRCDSECDACTWCLAGEFNRGERRVHEASALPTPPLLFSWREEQVGEMRNISCESNFFPGKSHKAQGAGRIGGGGGQQKKKSVCGWDNKGLYATNPFWDREEKQTALAINTQPWRRGDCKFITVALLSKLQTFNVGKTQQGCFFLFRRLGSAVGL